MLQTLFREVRKIVRLQTGALVGIVAMSAAAWWGTTKVEKTFGWVDHTHQVLYELEATLTHAISIQSGARGFALTGDEHYLTPYDSALLGIQQSIARLKLLTSDNPRQQARVVHLASLVDEEVSVMTQRLAARRRGGLIAASVAAADGSGKKAMNGIRAGIHVMQDEERRLLAERSSAATSAGWLTLSILLLDSAAAGALVVGAIKYTRRLPEAMRVPEPA